MPRDVEAFLPPPAVSARPAADIGGARDAGILMLLGLFTMIDAVLVVVWSLM